jgi:allantoin racemase
MKILIINPNSNPEITEKIQKTAEKFADHEFDVICKSTPGAPAFIETYEDQIRAAPGMIQLVREHADVDAFIVACHCDPNLDVLKEITKKPVIGIGEASMKIASMLGHTFSVISVTDHSIPNKEALARTYHLQHVMASVRAVDESSDEERYLKAAQKALEEDRAEVIVLGCAGMTGLDKKLEEKLQVPVLDGVVCALIIATGLVKYNVSQSKIRRYNPEPSLFL